MADLPALKPQVAADEINADIKAAGINKKDLEAKVAKDGSIRMEISKDRYDQLLAAGGNPKVAEFLGSGKFQLDVVDKDSAGATLGRLASRGAANTLLKEHVIDARGLTQDDVNAFNSHIDVVRDALVVGDLGKANDDLTKLKSAGADPKLVDEAKGLKSDQLTFNVEGGAVVSHLTPDQAAKLQKVFDTKGGDGQPVVTQEALFGPNAHFDKEKGTITVTGDPSKFAEHKDAIDVAVGLGNAGVVSGLLKPKAALEQHEHDGSRPATTPQVAGLQIPKGVGGVSA